MGATTPPPIIHPLIEPNTGIPTIPWINFFNSLFSGDTGSVWTPTFQNLTQVGGAPTITGAVYKLSAGLAFFRVTITPATNTSSVAGTTYIDNFPLTMSADGFCVAVSGDLGATPGMCDSSNNRVYVPAWSAVTVPLTIIGIVEAS